MCISLKNHPIPLCAKYSHLYCVQCSFNTRCYSVSSLLDAARFGCTHQFALTGQRSQPGDTEGTTSSMIWEPKCCTNPFFKWTLSASVCSGALFDVGVTSPPSSVPLLIRRLQAALCVNLFSGLTAVFEDSLFMNHWSFCAITCTSPCCFHCCPDRNLQLHPASPRLL